MSQGRDSFTSDFVPVLAAVKLLRDGLGSGRGLTAAALRRDCAGQEESRGVTSALGSSGLLMVAGPGLAFVVTGVAGQAAVKDADEPVREGAVRLPPNCGGIGYKESHAREAEEVRR
jgi:hypothetical protein